VLAIPAWSLSLAYCCLTFFFGYGAPVSSLLSLKMWAPLARLTYGAYLWHYMCLLWCSYGQRAFNEFSRSRIFFMYCGTVLMAFLLALASSVLVEKPFMSLEKEFMARLRQGFAGGKKYRRAAGDVEATGLLQRPLHSGGLQRDAGATAAAAVAAGDDVGSREAKSSSSFVEVRHYDDGGGSARLVNPASNND